MEILTIDQDDTRSIYDIASPNHSREIKFRTGAELAVILPSFYGKNIYSTHKTVKAAIKKYKQLRSQGYEGVVIADRNGIYFELSQASGEDILTAIY